MNYKTLNDIQTLIHSSIEDRTTEMEMIKIKETIIQSVNTITRRLEYMDHPKLLEMKLLRQELFYLKKEI